MWTFLQHLIQPKSPPYDPLEWEKWPISKRAQAVCLAWIKQGFGAPLSVYLFYLVKMVLYCGGWLFFCQWNQEELGTQPRWMSFLAFQKAIIWSCLFEGLGLGCGSGPLTARYLPPFGGALHFLRVGTFKRALFPNLPFIGGAKRTWFDVILYILWMLSALNCLFSESLQRDSLFYLAFTSLLLLCVDRVIFLALRAEHYVVLILAFLLGSQSISEVITFSSPTHLPPVWLLATVAVQCALWFWAGASKLNGHFATVVCVMLSNSPWCPQWLKSKMYINEPHDVRPSKWAHLAGAGGTLLEFSIPILFVIALLTMNPLLDAFTLQSLVNKLSSLDVMSLSLLEWAFILMLALHIFITSNVPLGVPLEWNVCVVYSAWFLFVLHGHDVAISIQRVLSESLIFYNETWLLFGILSLFLFFIPIFGNLYPHKIPFLLSMRYYAGNWPYTVWLIKKGDPLEALKALPRSAPWIDDQLAPFYQEGQRVGIMGRVMGFRMMHLQGRLITTLLHRLETQVLNTPIHTYFYSEGEIIAGIYLGWNFGDGHLHNEHLLDLFQEHHAFNKHDILCLCVEPQGWTDPSLSYRVVDVEEGLLFEGKYAIQDLKEGQPWDVLKKTDH